MQLQGSNTGFGMAFRSPTKADMPYFKRFLANANPNGKIDTKALGEFVIKQSANEKADLCYKHTRNGDVLQVFERVNPNNYVDVPCKNFGQAEPVKKGFLQKFKDLCLRKNDKIEYESLGAWDSLPEELRYAGKIADDMEKKLG